MTTYSQTHVTLGKEMQEAFSPAGATVEMAGAPPTRRHRFVADLARAAVSWPASVWGTLDVAVALGAFAFASLHASAHAGYAVAMGAIVYAALLFCCHYAAGLYDRHSFVFLSRVVASAILANCMATLMTMLILTALIGWHIRIDWTDALVRSAVGAIVLRVLARQMARWARVRIMFVGRRSSFRPLERELRRLFRGFYSRPLYVQSEYAMPALRERRLIQAIGRYCPDEIVVEDDDQTILGLVRNSSEILSCGCAIRSHAAYTEQLLGQVPIETMDHRGILGDGFTIGRHRFAILKRPLDIAIATVGLLLAGPVMLAVALAVRLGSPGPVFYSQTRVGRYGRPFRIYKFRTMRTDAEKNGAVWARAHDSRVTSIGRILRKARLDELPQLWNILMGDMSFVGPRPERPEFVEQLREAIPHYDLRHLVPPGLTGWAQVRYRYGASIEDGQKKLAYDLYYVRHYSPVFDVAICLRTLVAMAKGAR